MEHVTFFCSGTIDLGISLVLIGLEMNQDNTKVFLYGGSLGPFYSILLPS